jgi:hypothetical protein
MGVAALEWTRLRVTVAIEWHIRKDVAVDRLQPATAI